MEKKVTDSSNSKAPNEDTQMDEVTPIVCLDNCSDSSFSNEPSSEEEKSSSDSAHSDQSFEMLGNEENDNVSKFPNQETRKSNENSEKIKGNEEESQNDEKVLQKISNENKEEIEDKQTEIIEDKTVHRELSLCVPSTKTYNYCNLCPYCSELSRKLEEIMIEKEKAVSELNTKSFELETLKKEKLKYNLNEEELNYCMTSFQEIVKSYQEEHQKILEKLSKILKVDLSKSTKPLSQIVEAAVTDFSVNLREVSNELSLLENFCIYGSTPDAMAPVDSQEETRRNEYYYAIQKIENVKEYISKMKNI